MKELLHRLIWGLPLIGLFVACLLFLPPPFAAIPWLLALPLFGLEIGILLKFRPGAASAVPLAALVLAALACAFLVAVCSFHFLSAVFGVLSLSFAVYLLSLEELPARGFGAKPFCVAISLCWGAFPVGLLVALSFFPDGPLLLLALVGSLALLDTFSYFGGKLIGKRKLAPSVSPGKTWEGSAVGVAFCVGGGWALVRLLEIGGGPVFWLVTFFFAAVSAIAGDLIESKFKRLAGVKDSGKLMGAHGGVMDRADSYILSTSVYYFALFVGGFFDEVQPDFFQFPVPL